MVKSDVVSTTGMLEHHHIDVKTELSPSGKIVYSVVNKKGKL